MRKLKLFKTLLVAAGLTMGASAWADDEVYSWNSSESAYTDQANAETVYNGTSVGNLQIYSTQFRDWGSNDGTVKVNTSGKIAFYKFDLSTIKSKLTSEGGTITGVTFSFTGKTADGKACSKIRALGYNAEWSASTITNNNVSNTTGTITGMVTSTGSFQPLDDKAELSVGAETTLEVNAKTYVQSAINENKDYVSFAITANYTRAGLLNTSATLKVTYSTLAQADYTINYQLNGTTVASENNHGDIGSKVNAKPSIWNAGNTKKYFVADGATTSFTIANSGNEFNVAVREAEDWVYTVKAVVGGVDLMTISTNTVIEGEVASYGYPQYVAKDGVLYKTTAQGGNPWWGKSFTPSANNETQTFDYTAEGTTGIVFCSEAEDIPGLTVVSGGNTDIRTSNRKGAYASTETTITTLEPGIYRVFGATYGNAGTTFTLKVGDATVFTVTTDGNPKHTTGDYFIVNEPTSLVMPAAGNGGNSPKIMDYIIVQKANSSVPVTITSAGYATFSSNYALDFTGLAVKAYKASLQSDNTVLLTPVDKVPAGEGVVLAGAANTYDVPVIASADALTGNLLKASKDEEIAASTEGNYHYVLANGSTGVGFYNLAAAKNIGAGKAYLETTTALATSSSARVEWVFADGNTTGIEAVRNSQQAADSYYNLQGQRVAKTQKGLYIVNGKKVIMK